jgi:hypothetical protein
MNALNLYHQRARALWPGCEVSGSGPFCLVISRWNQPPVVTLFTDAGDARLAQQQHGGQLQRIEPMPRPKPVELGWE